MIDRFLAGGYDPVAFSVDLEDLLMEVIPEIEEENPMLAQELRNEFPFICADYEMGEDPSDFMKNVKAEYDRIEALI